jgi:hypothetical protein
MTKVFAAWKILYRPNLVNVWSERITYIKDWTYRVD